MTDIYSFLGLARKAGRLISGTENCEKAIRSNKAKLVILAEDASANTKKKFFDMCSYRKVCLKIFGQKAHIGYAIGKDVTAVVCIKDSGFAGKIIKMLDNLVSESGGETYGK